MAPIKIITQRAAKRPRRALPVIRTGLEEDSEHCCPTVERSNGSCSCNPNCW